MTMAIIITIIQFFFIYVPSQQQQTQLQTHHSVDNGNYIKDKQHKDNSRIIIIIIRTDV
jgi:hypothetical protein